MPMLINNILKNHLLLFGFLLKFKLELPAFCVCLGTRKIHVALCKNLVAIRSSIATRDGLFKFFFFY